MSPQFPSTRPTAAPRAHTAVGVGCAGFLGGPAAAGTVLALNYWRWGRKVAGAATVVAGFAAMAVIVWLGIGAPLHVWISLWVLQGVACFLVGWILQGRRIVADVRAGSGKASAWTDAGIGAAFGAVLAGAFIAYSVLPTLTSGINLDAPRSVAVGQDQLVWYGGGAGRDDAERLGEALRGLDYFSGSTPWSVDIVGPAGAREISFYTTDDDEIHLLYLSGLLERIAPAIGGKQVTLRLLDESGNETGRRQLEFSNQPFVDMGRQDHVWYLRGATRDDARRVGLALHEADYFDDTLAQSVVIAGPASDREVSFSVPDVDAESTVLQLSSLVESIAPAFDAKQVNVRLVGPGDTVKTWVHAHSDSPQFVDMGQDQQVWYGRGATREDALRVGDALREVNYFDDTEPAVVGIAGPVGVREISFAIESGWDDQTLVGEVKALAEAIAPVIGGKPITVRLVDVEGNERKLLRIN